MSLLLSELLCEPTRARGLAEFDWDVVIPQARKTSLLAVLLDEIRQADSENFIPADVRRHMEAAWVVYIKQQQNLRYEVKRLKEALAEAGEPVLLLKGAAYSAAGLRVARGRLLSDVDILVPADSLDAVEMALGAHGWSAGELHPYNNRYYREWMHELPPMEHVRRQSTVDVHHTILPPTAKSRIDVQALWRDAIEVAPGVYVLSAVDRVIHSATHLFHEGEFHHGLRDLRDLDQLLGESVEASGDSFYSELSQRAKIMGLELPLYYALRYTRMILGTAVPDETLVGLAGRRLGPLRLCLADFMFRRAFRPQHSSSALPLTGLALFMLYVRSHYLRMPLRYLVPHLARKAWMENISTPTMDKKREADHR